MTAIRETTKVKPEGVVEVRHPALPAGAEVEVIVLVPTKPAEPKPNSYDFLKILEQANLEGPTDWSEKVEEYLHDRKPL